MSQPALNILPNVFSEKLISVRGVERSFYFRPDTTDLPVISQVFDQKFYSFDQFPLNFGALELRRDEFVKELYTKIVTSGKKPLIIDGGANIGASPVYFADAYPMAQIVAIEPDQGNFDVMQKNVEGLPVECHLAALASEKGQCRVFDPGHGFWTIRTVPVEDSRQNLPLVERVTINDLYSAHAVDCAPFIVKLDIEGGEADVFSANTEWTHLTPIIIVEVHDWLFGGKAVSRPFLQCISSQNRDFIHIGENIFSISNEF